MSVSPGDGRPEDIAGIEAQLEATAAEVQASMQALSSYRDVLRETCGMAAASKLDELIYGQFGKDKLRRMLAHLVASNRGRDPVPDEITNLAREALNAVHSLNRDIAELHDLILTRAKE